MNPATAAAKEMMRRTPNVMRFENLELSMLNMTAYLVDGERRTNLHLTKKEWQFLNFMISRAGECISRDTVLDAIWNQVYVYPRLVDTMVSKLRKKIAGTGVEIESKHGFGYILWIGRPE